MATSKRRPRAADGKTWQQTKSENTRQTILDAAIECFFKLGYANTTSEKIARAAGVSRGAMLHHFSSRAELVRAAVEHLAEKRLQLFEQDERRIQQSPHSLIDEGIDGYWRQLQSPLFVVFHELQVAARTDPELYRILVPIIAEFDRKWLELSTRIFPDLARSPQFLLANRLTVFLLEGLAVNEFTRKPAGNSDAILDALKAQLHAMFADVLSGAPEAARQLRDGPRPVNWHQGPNR